MGQVTGMENVGDVGWAFNTSAVEEVKVVAGKLRPMYATGSIKRRTGGGVGAGDGAA